MPQALGPKIGPQRSTKKTEKLKLLPNPDLGEDGEDEESGRDVYSQYTRIKDPTARRDAARLGKADRSRLPRVTAYCTANRYEMEAVVRFFKGRGKSRGANPKLIDECVYTPYSYASKNSRDNRDPVQNYERRHSTGQEGNADETPPSREDLIDLHAEGEESMHVDDQPSHVGHEDSGVAGIPSEDLLGQRLVGEGHAAEEIPDFDIQIHTPEVFLFDYGVVVIWACQKCKKPGS